MRRYRIGRAETNDIVLLEPSVSREHAELIRRGRGLFTIRDLGSSYGTAVRQDSDWSLITAMEVRPDTHVRIGEFETTVADLLRDAEPAADRADAPAASPWAAPAPRLSPRARARHPETIYIAGGPMAAWRSSLDGGAPGRPNPLASRWRAMPEDTRILLSLLAGVGAFLAIGLIVLAVALIR